MSCWADTEASRLRATAARSSGWRGSADTFGPYGGIQVDAAGGLRPLHVRCLKQNCALVRGSRAHGQKPGTAAAPAPICQALQTGLMGRSPEGNSITASALLAIQLSGPRQRTGACPSLHPLQLVRPGGTCFVRVILRAYQSAGQRYLLASSRQLKRTLERLSTVQSVTGRPSQPGRHEYLQAGWGYDPPSVLRGAAAEDTGNQVVRGYGRCQLRF